MLQAGTDPHEDRAEAVTDVGAGADQGAEAAALGGVPLALVGDDLGVEGDVQGVHGGSFPKDDEIVRPYDHAIN